MARTARKSSRGFVVVCGVRRYWFDRSAVPLGWHLYGPLIACSMAFAAKSGVEASPITLVPARGNNARPELRRSGPVSGTSRSVRQSGLGVARLTVELGLRLCLHCSQVGPPGPFITSGYRQVLKRGAPSAPSSSRLPT